MADPMYTEKDLYGASGKPLATDMMQGKLGDCYLLASLGSIATQHPETIENAIHYNADKNTFSVTLYQQDAHGAAKPTQIDVSQAELQVDRAKGVDSPGYWSQAGNPPLWPEVMETAYAKLKADKSPETMDDELAHIGKGDWPNRSLFALTGKEDTILPASSLTDQDKAYKATAAGPTGRSADDADHQRRER